MYNLMTSAKISDNAIKEIIKKQIELETGRVVKSIEFNVDTVTTGYGYNEHQSSVFSGATVHFKDENVSLTYQR